MSQLERTFAIIKPDSVARGIAGEILTAIEQNGFRILGMRMVHLNRKEAEGFYAVHRGKPFFPGLIDFMTEGPVIVMALEREDAIRKWREVMGATNPANAAEGTIRKRFGTAIDRNCAHGSDGPETARTEIAYFFREVELL
ncbi:MAG: nucleoside-diphosphate kinase [Acidobacteriota bacterium]